MRGVKKAQSNTINQTYVNRTLDNLVPRPYSQHRVKNNNNYLIM